MNFFTFYTSRYVGTTVCVTISLPTPTTANIEDRALCSYCMYSVTRIKMKSKNYQSLAHNWTAKTRNLRI